MTDGDDTVNYFYETRIASAWEVGAAISYTNPDGSIAADGEVLEIEPGRRLVVSFHARWSPEIAAEGPVRESWELIPGDGEGEPTRVIVTTAIVPGSVVESEFSGGTEYILSGLKTWLETGQPMVAA
jgi:uncharacterized protein YndB with AHSA1/START domain